MYPPTDSQLAILQRIRPLPRFPESEPGDDKPTSGKKKKRKAVKVEMVRRWELSDAVAENILASGAKPEPSEPYRILFHFIQAHHEHLLNACIVLVWKKGVQPDKDSRIELGKMKKASDIDRELHGYDFVMFLNSETWAEFDVHKRNYVVDHEACHGQVDLDKDGNVKKDERGRICYRIRKHDIEDFNEMPERHGLCMESVQRFARACWGQAQVPLFGGVAQPEATAATAPSANGIHKPASPESPDAWRAVLFLDILRNAHVPAKIIAALFDANIATLGQFADFTAKKRLTDIKGVGDAAAERIEKVLELYWADVNKAKAEKATADAGATI
jgi:hypothetical protein